MNIYYAAVFTDLVRHSVAWNRLSRDTVTGIVAEYRYLSQSLASQYGRRHENFTGDGHLFLFESADVGVHFALKLIAYWKQRRRSLLGVLKADDLPIRVGCHFGECTRMGDEDAWIGRAINIAKRVESSADPDAFFVTETLLELIDLPMYRFSAAGLYELRGDFLPQRPLYRLSSVDHAALAARPEGRMTAEDWFLRGVGGEEGERGKPEEELECYQQAIRLRPNYPEAHNNSGVLLKAKGDGKAAAHQYLEALRLWPQYPEAHYNYAILLEQTGDDGGAAAHYRAALEHRPDYVDARLRYAGLMDSIGDQTEAERNYEEALRLRPDFAEAHNNYGIFLEQRGDVATAEVHYRQALDRRPDYAEAHYNYAMLLERVDRVGAAEHYRAAIRALPDYAEAHNNLAALLHEDGELAAAEKHYLTALRLRPCDQQANYNLALLAKERGDDELADRYFRQANGVASSE